jgi:hypothetical protein
MVPRKRYYVVEFQDAINRFKSTICNDTMPTIDVDVAVSQVCTAFETNDIPAAMQKVAVHMAVSDWLFEHEVWDTKQEEDSVRLQLYHATLKLAHDMFYKLHDIGMFPTTTESYSYRKYINDYTIAFTRETSVPLAC